MENTEIMDKQVEAKELDGLIKIHANLAWQNLLESARLLKKMRDTKLYIELGYENFGDYSQKSLNIKERQAYTYISTYENLGERFLQSNANLGITKLSLLSSVAPIDRDKLTDNNDLAGMTVEEVKALVAENSSRGEQIELLTENIRDITAERDTALENVPELKDKIAELEKELEAEKNKPTEVAVSEPDAEVINRIKEDAKADAQKVTDKAVKAAEKKLSEAHKKELEDLKAKNKTETETAIAVYKQKLKDIDGEKAEILKKAENLEKQLSVASSAETVKFQFYFEALQGDTSKICESIKKLKTENPETADKFKCAVIKYTEIMKNSFEQV